MATMCTRFLTLRKFIFSHSVYLYVSYHSHSPKECVYVMESAVLFPVRCDLGRIQSYTQNDFPEYSGWKTKREFLKSQPLMLLK